MVFLRLNSPTNSRLYLVFRVGLYTQECQFDFVLAVPPLRLTPDYRMIDIINRLCVRLFSTRRLRRCPDCGVLVHVILDELKEPIE